MSLFLLLLYILVYKDQLWKITVTVPVESLHDFKVDLTEKNVPFVAYETSWDKCKVVDIFSKNRSESKIVRNIININFNGLPPKNSQMSIILQPGKCMKILLIIRKKLMNI